MEVRAASEISFEGKNNKVISVEIFVMDMKEARYLRFSFMYTVLATNEL